LETATQPATPAANTAFDAMIHAERWIADYCARSTSADVLCEDADPAWAAMFAELDAADNVLEALLEMAEGAVTLATDQAMRPEFDVTLAYNPE